MKSPRAMRSTLVIVASLVYLSEAIRLPDPSWARVVTPVVSSKARLLAEGAETCETIFSCLDCSTSRVCRPTSDNIVQYDTIKCPSDRPYCDQDSGSCMKKAPKNCGTSPDSFICLEKEQHFPDPDCKKYHYCDSNYQPTLYNCADGTVYNADLAQCVESTECGKFSCSGNDLLKIKHSNFPRFYAMCKSVDNTDAPLVVGVCPEQYTIDVNSENCEPDCSAHGNGNIPDFSDCTKYWSCTSTILEDGNAFMEKKSKSCATGQAFDRAIHMCADNSDGHLCKK